ncbi:MAG: hypothetical protein KAS07_01645 [Candidatus Pacebacteria bacterium]|nr:hypothetical protein [Candidatus Paceibacterota bacterium]
MWLITTLITALLATLARFLLKNKYKLDLLSLMLWGATIMILVDHVLGYEGGKFLEMEIEGLIKNGVLLGIVMLLPIFLIWIAAILISKFKRNTVE